MPLAIDIGTRAMHLVQGKVSKKTVLIKRALSEPIPAGLFQDGNIREYGGMEVALKNMLAKYKIRDKACSLTINGSQVYTRELDVPGGKQKIVDDVVAFEVQSSMGNNKDAAVEYVRLKQKVVDKPEMIRVRASAIPVDTINDYYKLLKNCGLRAVALDVHPNAMIKAISDTTINDRRITESTSLMLIDMGGVSTTAYVVVNGDVIYSRIIPVGGIDIERYISNHNSEAPIEQHKQLETIDLSLASLREDEELADAVRPLVTTVNDGIQRIQQFLAGRLQGGRVDAVLLYGRTATYKNFDKTLGEAFSLPTDTIRSIGKVTMPQDQPIAPYVNAIGALIRLD